MKLIKNNPYRIVGLLVGASAREQERQVKRLKQFIEAEKEPQDDFSFPTLGKLHRTIESVSDAASKLNLDHDKMNSALFWFYKGNPITDEPAFDFLKESNQQSASEIWVKLLASGDVTQRNWSAFQNLSTLLLCHSFNGSQINMKLLGEGISLKLKFLESDFIIDFKAEATDETYKTTKKELQLLFLNQVQYEIEKNGGVTSKEFLDIINNQEFIAKEEFLKNFVQKPIEQIEKKINVAKAQRKSNKADAAKAGKALFAQTSESIAQLKSILGISNIKFSSTSDKVSNEILQCGIVYFSHFRETATDPSTTVSELFRIAKSLAVGNIAKERCKENTAGLQEWIDNKPERDKQNLISKDFEFITEKLNRFQTLSASISNAKDFIISCIPSLDKIKNTLGSNDELYLKISSAIVTNAEGMIVSAVNESVDQRTKYVEYINYKTNPLFGMNFSAKPSLSDLMQGERNIYKVTPPPAPEYSLEELKSVIRSAWKAIVTLGNLDMSRTQRKQYISNKDALKKLHRKIIRSFVFFNDKPIHIGLIVLGVILAILLLIYVIWGEEAFVAVLIITAFLGFMTLLRFVGNN